jgi:hypothetical protein
VRSFCFSLPTFADSRSPAYDADTDEGHTNAVSIGNEVKEHSMALVLAPFSVGFPLDFR